ncbi:MAG TPA: hypothetical protein VFT45_03310 [Longimicrobium sp.]|nr:hypothetical protein [Longimicrobium sp.]
MLEEAIRVAKALPESEQDAIAATILAEIEDEQRWAEAFASSPDTLAELAREALAEHRAGRTLPLDPDRM